MIFNQKGIITCKHRYSSLESNISQLICFFYACWVTPSRNTGLRQLPNVSMAFNTFKKMFYYWHSLQRGWLHNIFDTESLRDDNLLFGISIPL